MPSLTEHLPEGIQSSLSGALFLYNEAQRILSFDLVGDLEEAQSISQAMSTVITAAFYSYHRFGHVSDFFAQVPLSPSPDFMLETPLILPSRLFQALSEGHDRIERNRPKENDTTNIYIGTVGRNNAGKGIITSYLEKKYGFQAYPLSDRVREIATAFGNPAPHDRDVLIETGKHVKEVFDAAILIRHSIALLSELGRPNRLLFDGLRAQGEATGILKLASENTQTVCIAISTGESDPATDLEMRYRRALSRKSDKDPIDDTREAFELFKQQDEKEATGITAAMSQATHTIINKDGDHKTTFEQIDTIMESLGIAPLL